MKLRNTQLCYVRKLRNNLRDLRNRRINVFIPLFVIYWMTLYLRTQCSQFRFVTGHTKKIFTVSKVNYSRSQWPRGLRRGSAAARLLGFWVRIPLGAWIFEAGVVCSQVEVSSLGWSLVQTRSTDCGVSECDHESSTMRRPWFTGGCWTMLKKRLIIRPLTIPPSYPQIFKCFSILAPCKKWHYLTKRQEIIVHTCIAHALTTLQWKATRSVMCHGKQT